MDENILKQIKEAYKDNLKDMRRARENNDFEEERECIGFQMALDFVLSLYRIYLNN